MRLNSTINMQQLSTILPRLFFQLPPHVGREKRTGKSDIGHASINYLHSTTLVLLSIRILVRENKIKKGFFLLFLFND